MNRRPSRRAAAGIAALILAAGFLPAAAQHTLTVADKIKLSEMIESIKFGGDLRLRHEYIQRTTVQSNDRSRLRYRLRLGTDIGMPHGVLVGLRLASGNGEALSTNQSYDNLGSQKDIWVDLAYARWAPEVSQNGAVALASGRMPNPLWRVYSSDILFDEDFNPEGVGESFEWRSPELDASLFANGLQMVADEDSNTARNQWLFSQQAGADLPLPLMSRLKVAAAYHKWSDENRNSFGQAATQNGNRRNANGSLTNRFGVGEVTGQLSTWVGEVPLLLQATAIKNLRARGDIGTDADMGHQVGFILGSSKAEEGWEVAAFKKYSESDATVADLADSDFGEGGTNRKGYVFWAGYGPRSWLYLRAKYFTTKVANRPLNAANLDINRAQVDVTVKF